MQPYALDPTFGTGGTALTTLVGGAGSAMALQSDGKIVMVGGRTLSAFVLARFDVDGALDDSFGEGGIVLTDIAGGFGLEQARAVAIQPDDQKIVVVGNTPGRIGADVCVLRYEPDGRLDETFATGGIFTGIGPGTAKDVALQSDGRILVAGSAQSGFFLARLLSDGQLDPSFGLAGLVTIEAGGRGNFAENVVIQPDGLIVLSGWSGKPDNQFDQVTDLARYQPDGQLDPTFGTGGTLTLDANVGADLVVQPDGRLVLVGNSDSVPTPAGGTTSIAVMRLEPNGTVDDSFGDHGTSLISVTDRKPNGGAGTALRSNPTTGASSSPEPATESARTSSSPACTQMARPTSSSPTPA